MIKCKIGICITFGGTWIIPTQFKIIPCYKFIQTPTVSVVTLKASIEIATYYIDITVCGMYGILRPTLGYIHHGYD